MNEDWGETVLSRERDRLREELNEWQAKLRDAQQMVGELTWKIDHLDRSLAPPGRRK